MPSDPEIYLPYGGRPLRVQLPGGAIVADLPTPATPPGELDVMLRRALDAPIDSSRLEDLARGIRQVLIIVSDATRDDPRRELLTAVRERLPPGVGLTIAIANGTHAPAGPTALGLEPGLLAGARIVDHDSRDPSALVRVGVTGAGTPVIVNRCVMDAQLVVATGRIKPHYFAGYGAGAKALFPGLGENDAIRTNHEMKRLPGAAPGTVDGNPCRADLEEAARLVPRPQFLLNAVLDADGGARDAVAGNVESAFRAGAAAAAPLFTVCAPRSRCVVVSDHLPLTGSLYQASKLVAAAAPLVEDGGTVVVAAQCPEGTGPLRVVNEAIYELGIRPRLPARHRVVLVSDLSDEAVAATYCEAAGSVEEALLGCGEKPVILPRAGVALVRVETAS